MTIDIGPLLVSEDLWEEKYVSLNYLKVIHCLYIIRLVHELFVHIPTQ